MDSLLAGTLILPWRVHCAGIMSSAAVPPKKHSGHRESHSGIGRKPFAFPPESLFAFSPESFSPCPGIRTKAHCRSGRGDQTLLVGLKESRHWAEIPACPSGRIATTRIGCHGRNPALL